MKKNILFISILVFVLLLTGCTSNKDALKFKEEYESLNGQTSKSGKEHRTLDIDEDNPFIYITASDLIEKIENEETFYVYFGDKLCPWCRSVVEKAIEIANKKGINKIYYIPIWDDDGNEILRDKYELKDGKAKKVSDGIEEYEELLEYFEDVLSDYNLTDEDGNKVEVGEKRIYAPNFIYVKDGETKKLVTGISESQKDSREKLSKEILKDEEEAFNKFFK